VRNGLTEAEISEIILHTALYAGLPRANRALAIAQETLDH
jgi:alkylhydroperoxidase/carboxymuconolactone decarboxylase family protein YurZ